MAYVSDRTSLDLTSRLLSIFGVIIALGVGAFVFTRVDSSNDTTSEDQIAALKAEFAKALQKQEAEYRTTRESLEKEYQAALDRQDERIRNWDGRLTGSLTEFRTDADALLRKMEDQGITEEGIRRLAFKETIDDLRTQIETLASTTTPADAATEPGGLNGPANSRSDENSRSGDVATSDPADEAPEITSKTDTDSFGLKLATTTLRAGKTSTLLVVENDSAADIYVDRIRFRPKSRFALTDENESASNLRSIVFGPEDNTAADPTLHGTYDHRPKRPIKISAGEKVSLRFSILDPTHEGWGFDGRLVINYANGDGTNEYLVAESAKVAFTK